MVITFLLPNEVLAHRSGCHRWHSCPSDSGSYVCGDLGYPCQYPTYPESDTTIYYKPTPNFPSTNASWETSPNNAPNKTFDLSILLDDTSPSQYSATLNKCVGCDPGPLADFYSNNFKFSNISPGTWYLNVKKKIDGVWSTVLYWEIKIPQWTEPTPLPKLLNRPIDTPELLMLPINDNSNNSSKSVVEIIIQFLLKFFGLSESN